MIKIEEIRPHSEEQAIDCLLIDTVLKGYHEPTFIDRECTRSLETDIWRQYSKLRLDRDRLLKKREWTRVGVVGQRLIFLLMVGENLITHYPCPVCRDKAIEYFAVRDNQPTVKKYLGVCSEECFKKMKDRVPDRIIIPVKLSLLDGVGEAQTESLLRMFEIALGINLNDHDQVFRIFKANAKKIMATAEVANNK